MSRDAQTHELVITGVSQLHLDVIRNRLKKRFDLEVVTHEPKIPYRETITTDAAADHRHKKQTGGRGQFGEVHLRVYPLPREIKTQQELEEQFANKSRFEKLRLWQGDFAVVSACVSLDLAGAIVRDSRVVLGSVAPTPYRARAVEQRLAGRALSAETIAAAAEAWAADAHPLERNQWKVDAACGLVRRCLLMSRENDAR